MTFEEALGALLGLLGDRVEVAIESPAGGMVAHFTGELGRGHDLSARDDPSAPVFFSFADEPGSGFVLDPRVFAGAQWSSDRSVLRLEDRAGVVLLIERADDG